MIRIVLALSLLVALGRAAEAGAQAPTPRLKELVTVSSEIVRIGDLVENAGDAADIAVFRSPDLGDTGSVAVARIAEALRPHGVAGLDTRGLREVVVTRLSRAISVDDIKQRIARAFAGQFGFGDAENIDIILDRNVRVLHVENTVTAELAIVRLNVEPRTGRFDVAFELPASVAARRLPLRFTGTATELVPAATLARSLRPGEVVRQADVVVARRPKLEVGADAIAAEQAIGLAAKRPLRGGQVLRPADLTKPQVVQRNEVVTLVYAVPGVMLTVRGKALEAGAEGDIVSVVNVQTNRTIQGTVSGPGRVSITAATPLVAAAAAPAADGRPRHRIQ
jgi:flagella basal body P-ring formation protein FlgA